jgi:hypothetical protein
MRIRAEIFLNEFLQAAGFHFRKLAPTDVGGYKLYGNSTIVNL